LPVDGAGGRSCRALGECSQRLGLNRAWLETGQMTHISDEVGEPKLVLARARPTERTTRPSRHFWGAKTCSIATGTRALVALPW
jgi:hypothetical protein